MGRNDDAIVSAAMSRVTSDYEVRIKQIEARLRGALSTMGEIADDLLASIGDGPPDPAKLSAINRLREWSEGRLMTEQEFIAGYCARSGWTEDRFRQRYVALPCACGDDGCHGWAKVSNDPESIADHMELYAPRSTGPGDSNG